MASVSQRVKQALAGCGKRQTEMADYFGILKSDLIERKMTEEKEKDNETLAGIIVRMRTDKDFASLVESLYMYDSAKIKSIAEMLDALAK